MPEQILLQGKILGTEEFLLAGPAEGRSVRSAGEDLLAGKSQWITLLCEVLPRALLAELGLARILLGSSGGGQFLLVLPGRRARGRRKLPDGRRRADRRTQLRSASSWSGPSRITWAIGPSSAGASTRSCRARRNAPLQHLGAAAFQPFVAHAGATTPTCISPRNSAPRCAKHRRSAGRRRIPAR